MSTSPPPRDPRQENLDTDLGFGSIVARESRQRLLNRDGTFNVRREGLGVLQSLSAYHYLLKVSWPKFIGFAALGFVLANGVFACAYAALGSDALHGIGDPAFAERFGKEFFFSVHTMATIGYGNVSPSSVGANVLVTVEALVGLLGFGLVTGVMFARFSRPVANIMFSSNAIIAPYRGITALMIRIANQRSSQIVDLDAKVIMSRRRTGSSSGEREFAQLKLEREHVVFFPLSWTIVHPIDKDSPLYSVCEDEMRNCDTEFLLLVTGFEETFSQTVHARTSYRGDEVVFGARFRSIFNPSGDGEPVSIDIRKVSEIEKASLDKP